MEDRISKILSAYGVCSRRAAEELIRAGRVTVNGTAAELGQKADVAVHQICVDGMPLQPRSAFVYIMLHKPRGYVTTVSDEKGRKTVMDLLRNIPERIWPVGRLDMDSEGLLLLTNDGDLTNQLIHPRHQIDKTYHVWVQGNIEAAVPVLRSMTTLDTDQIRKPFVKIISRQKDGGLISIIIHEGKYHQVRRMCAAAQLSVTRLKRVQEGAVSLGTLPLGTWRRLTEEEVNLLKKH